MSNSRPQISRRYMQPLPSRKKHVLLVTCFLTVIISYIIIITNVQGQASDARSIRSVAIAPPELPPASDTLEAQSEALPDLLAGDVLENINPTIEIDNRNTETLEVTTDALGNPLTSTLSSQAIALPTRPIAVDPSTSVGPRVITIDGKPIDGQRSALVPAPIAGLTKISAYGQVPAISRAGVTPLSAYKRPFVSTDKKTVSIIIGGLGVNRSLTQKAINDLPSAVTLSFAAHSTGLQGWVNKARAKGHEVLIELPLESYAFDAGEPGADRALLASRNVSANPRNLDWLLSRAQGAFGVTNYNGDLFLNRSDVTAPLLDKLARTGLGFIFDGSVSAPSLSALARSARLPYASGYNLIDTVQDSQQIQSNLKQLSDTAQLGASPIGVGFAYPETLRTVKSWSQSLEVQGITLAPASHILR